MSMYDQPALHYTLRMLSIMGLSAFTLPEQASRHRFGRERSPGARARRRWKMRRRRGQR